MQKTVQSDFFRWRQEVGRLYVLIHHFTSLVEVERVAVEVGEHVILEHLLVAVQGELLAAHGADFPVTFHMLLELALVIVGWEDDLTQWTSFHVHAAHGRVDRIKMGERERETESKC